MKLALRLARKARGTTSPNPAVGAVVVRGNKVLGKGFTGPWGQAHAEVNALEEAGSRGKGATLYVTLEPCIHHGRTPPCAPRIVAGGIRRVVYAVRDPNPLVNGKGHRYLARKGLQVEAGLYAERALEIMEGFFSLVGRKRPLVVLKSAQTWDGRIAAPNGESRWITGPGARKEAHKLRACHDAVLVGIGTVLKDDPLLTVRHCRGRCPARIVLDSRCRLPRKSKLAQSAQSVRTIVACRREPGLPLPHVEYWKIPDAGGRLSVPALLRRAARERIASILVEGGSGVSSSFWKSRCVDRMVVFVGGKVLGDGVPVLQLGGKPGMSRATPVRNMRCKSLGPDLLLTGSPDFAGSSE